MIQTAFFVFLQAIKAADNTNTLDHCRACTFLPWIAVVAVVCLRARSTERLCSDLFKIAIHVTALALLHTRAQVYAYACSVHSILTGMYDAAIDVTSVCLFSLICVVCVPIYVQLCPFDIPSETQVAAIAWTEIINAVHFILWKLI